MSGADYRKVFKRMETDDEYRKRCCREWCAKRTGVELDEHIEDIHGSRRNPLQRRIIEDVS
jgi:hypothetical protein